MAKEDEEKTSLIVSQGIFCYSKMPFGLKNAGATYQHLVDKAFKKQIGKNLEVYVDDLVIKSRTEHEIIRDIEKTFKTLREINMKLNPKKCTFGIEEGMFLGYKVNTKGIKEAVSVVLMTKREAKKMAIYFVSRALPTNQADFIVEHIKDDKLDTSIEAKEELLDSWTLFTEGSSCVDGSRAGLILTNPKGAEFTYALRLRFDPTNNEAEYEALIAGLRIAEQMGVKNLQTNSINEAEVLVVVEEEEDTWMTPIYNYLMKETLPVEKEKARAIHHKSGRYTIIAWTMVTMHGATTSKLSSGLVERANRSLEEGIKARLDERSKDWIEEIPHVLWAHHTMIKSSNEDIPFSLTYGIEAVIPTEIGMPTLRTTEIDMVQNDEALEINLDLLEERREQAAIREARSKEKMERYYNSKVRNISFKTRDLVYWKNDANHAKDSGKLSPKWEGPYKVTEALGKGAYKLRDYNRKLLPQNWNVRNLKKCYVHEMQAPFPRKFRSGRGNI
ncbi:reverse transcriptase domain-containing protein [Tanacetum coccineum]